MLINFAYLMTYLHHWNDQGERQEQEENWKGDRGGKETPTSRIRLILMSGCKSLCFWISASSRL